MASFGFPPSATTVAVSKYRTLALVSHSYLHLEFLQATLIFKISTTKLATEGKKAIVIIVSLLPLLLRPPIHLGFRKNVNLGLNRVLN